MTVAATCFKWVDLLENQFDKSWIELDTTLSTLEDDEDMSRNRFNVVLADNTISSESSDPAKMMEETLRLRSLVEEINRSKVKTDYELVNLRINLEEAKNENSTVLQVTFANNWCLDCDIDTKLLFRSWKILATNLLMPSS